MAKVLMFNFPGEGHVNPTLALIEELVKRGEEVVYYCVEEYKGKIEKTGASFRPYENFLEKVDMLERMNGKINSSELLLHMVKSMDNIIKIIIEELKEEKYDYVIYDNNFAVGWMIAESLNLPKISSCTTFAVTKKLFNVLMNNHNEGDKKSPLYQEVTHILEKWQKVCGFSMNQKKNVMTCAGNITIVYTSKFFQPDVEELDDSYIFVGPSITSRKDVQEVVFKQKEEEKLIYISMGTVFNQQMDFYYICFETFKNFPATIILSVGKHIDINQLKNIPPNFKVYNYVPQLEVLKQANLFITHGGMNSSSESLYFGVPMIVIPVMGDQLIVAQRIEDLKAGIQLNLKKLTPVILHHAVIEILSNNVYLENSHKIKCTLKDAGGYRKAADTIEIFKLNMGIK
ncbi:TPA: glycosyl transferase [Bacillus cereus]|uniref:macrolide family glycosyltransferase n=1 Tax=Bacillus sp. GeD10 TaxID=1301086 RepID=UPI0002D22932|nr:macrolide family glycosyltransferase [Bacillus sp. GeD10]MEB9337088.1 glycosyltransferase [Bacillus cereus]CCW05415.1 Macrolide glycosyltransferase [Bacillus sp. GeD10]HEF1856879.1 glycosyl transferase [Bacillus cereus]HEF1857581.1 glycosyl transferase [Bacillus cereus]HEF1869230.1 glycosyl transferase [Bacillus cereus]